MSDSSQLLHGETLVWVTCDVRQVFSAGLKGMLEAELGATRGLQTILAGSFEECVGLVGQNRAGLVTLVLGPEDEPLAMRVLRQLQLRSPACLRCVYFPEHLQLDELRLKEAGAQIVAQQIPWIQKRLPRLVALARRRTGGNHPITTGLIDRLPWKP